MLKNRTNFLPPPGEREELAEAIAQTLSGIERAATCWTLVRSDVIDILLPHAERGAKSGDLAKHAALVELISLLDDAADLAICDEDGCFEPVGDPDWDFCKKHADGP